MVDDVRRGGHRRASGGRDRRRASASEGPAAACARTRLAALDWPVTLARDFSCACASCALSRGCAFLMLLSLLLLLLEARAARRPFWQ